MVKKFIKKIILGISLFSVQTLISFKYTLAQIKYTPLQKDAFGGIGKEISEKTSLAEFLSYAFELGLAICAALAVVMIVWGGVEYMLSESLFSKEEGRKKIRNAIYGLLLAVFSWLILYIINPSILDWSRFGPK
jgi:hypothetical protein